MTGIKILKLNKTFSDTGIKAVDNFSLDISAGSFTVIIGVSGCGKTTLLKLIAGLEQPDIGTERSITKQILVDKTDDRSITFYSDSDISAHRITHNLQPKFGFMFQDSRLLPWLTVKENLKLAFLKHDTNADFEIEQILSLVGLNDWQNAYPAKLSGGMAQRVALARALCRKPDVLLLDEPFASLDAFNRFYLREELGKLCSALKITVILVTHDIEEVVFLGDKVIIMEDGKFSKEYIIMLPKPRNHRSYEFQEYCKAIEEKFIPKI